MEKTNWRGITELAISRVYKWRELDVGIGKMVQKDDLKIYFKHTGQRLRASVVLNKCQNALDLLTECKYWWGVSDEASAHHAILVECFFAAMAMAITSGFITPEEVEQCIAPKDRKLMERALFNELDGTNGIMDPNWKPPDRA